MKFDASGVLQTLDAQPRARRNLIAAAERYGEEWNDRHARVPMFVACGGPIYWMGRDGVYESDGYRTTLLGNQGA